MPFCDILSFFFIIIYKNKTKVTVMIMKRIMCFLVAVMFLFAPFSAKATETENVYPYDMTMNEFWFEEANAEYISESDAKALLLMEYSTGMVMFAQNEKEHLPIASVTKVMSTLLVMEALDSGRISLSDSVTVSANAASMGGSQVFLEEGETMSVEDLLKSLVVASANDATVALGEYICGSEAAFVAAMNSRAKELGCENTNFVNTNGLPAEGHYSCALDVAVITRELMHHKDIFKYTGIWMDTIRNGTFGLANTNKLIRFYKGATGMKTGFTDEAMYCLSGTAERDGMQLIAVVLGSSTSNSRFAAAKSMLDYGFANYAVVSPQKPEIQPVEIKRGVCETVEVSVEDVSVLMEKGNKGTIEPRTVIFENIQAPITAGMELGYVSYYIGEKEIARGKITAVNDVAEVSYGTVLGRIFGDLMFK